MSQVIICIISIHYTNGTSMLLLGLIGNYFVRQTPTRQGMKHIIQLHRGTPMLLQAKSEIIVINAKGMGIRRG